MDITPYKLPERVCAYLSQYAEFNNVFDKWIREWPSQEAINNEFRHRTRGRTENFRSYWLENEDQSILEMSMTWSSATQSRGYRLACCPSATA